MDWKLILKAILVILFISYLLTIESRADVTSSGATDNTQSATGASGSNTAITGGYSSETTYQDGSSNTTSTTNSTTNSSNLKTAVNAANTPAVANYNSESCIIPLGVGVSLLGISFGLSNFYEDVECQRRKNARMLDSMGLKVSALALLCKNREVFISLLESGSPCPAGNGLIGVKAKLYWETNPELRPDYEDWKRLQAYKIKKKKLEEYNKKMKQNQLRFEEDEKDTD